MKAAEIGIQLRRARRKAGLTQAEMARRMGTTQSSVARAESGLVRPSLDFIERFARETREPLRLGSLVVWSAGGIEDRRGERAERIHRAIGDRSFNPWLRNPTPSEQRSLVADGLTRDYFEGREASRARGR